MDHRIAAALRVLEQRMADEVDFAEVARAVGLSYHRFHHLFMQEKSETPAAYLRRIRLDAAALRLRWTRDSAGTIAHTLGYASQAAFTRAFRARFGTTPAAFRRQVTSGQAELPPRGAHRVVLREVESFRILAKRFFGDLYGLRSYWQSFLPLLPQEVGAAGRALFLGLVSDDPRLTPVEQLRYDCCVTVDADLPLDPDDMARRGLDMIETRPGPYLCLDYEGPVAGVAPAYQFLTDLWATASRYTVTDDPVIEVHAVPRCHMPPEQLSFRILLPVH